MAALQGFRTVDYLKLQVEDDYPNLPNLIPNPDGDLGASGWNYVATAGLTAIPGPALRITCGLIGATIESDLIQVTGPPGLLGSGGVAEDVKARLAKVAGVTIKARFNFYDSAKAPVSSGSYTADQSTNATFDVAAEPVPVGVKYVGLEIVTVGATSGQTVDFTGVALIAGSSADVAATTPLAFPGWVDILGPTVDIKVQRKGLELGMLTATVRDSVLDPARGGILTQGKRVQLLALDSLTSEWERIFPGEVFDAVVTYDLLLPNENKRPKIALTAVDRINVLANTPATEGVATIDELPYVLAGARVAWNVNGSVSPVDPTGVTVVANDPSGTALGQVAITRDSNAPAYAWVDRYGVLQVQDAAHMSSSSVATFDESFYSADGLDIGYALSDCINAVTLHVMTTVETVFGPFVDDASRARNGKQARDFTIYGTYDATSAEAFADAILAANAWPALRVNSVSRAVTLDDFANGGAVFRDLYDLVAVENWSASITDSSRVTSIEHTITPRKWRIDFGFAAEGLVAAPRRRRGLLG